MTNKILIFFFSLFLFFYAYNVKADNLVIDQNQQDYFQSQNGDFFSSQTFIMKYDTISAIGFWFREAPNMAQEFEFMLCNDNNEWLGRNYVNQQLGCGDRPILKDLTTVITATSSIAETKIQFLDPITNVLNKDVLLIIKVKNSVSGQSGVYVKNANVYPDGHFYDSSGADMTFRIYTNDFIPEVVVVNENGFGLNIISPDTNNFPYFELGNGTATMISTPFKIVYSINPMASTSSYNLKVESSVNQNMASSTLKYNQSFASSYCNEIECNMNFLYNNTALYNTFKIIRNSDGRIMYSMKIAINQPTVPIANDRGFWGNLFYFIFVPSTDTLTDFQSTVNQLYQKVPFGYWKLATDSTKNLSLNYTASPQASMTVFNHSFKIFDLSNNNIFSQYFPTIRTISTYIFYFTLLMYFIFRIPKIIDKQ